MNNETFPLDYNDFIILYFLSKQSRSRNNTEISIETEVYYQTVTEKVKKLESYRLLGTIMKGRTKIVRITESGKKYLQDWIQTPFGKEMKQEFDEILKKKKT